MEKLVLTKHDLVSLNEPLIPAALAQAFSVPRFEMLGSSTEQNGSGSTNPSSTPQHFPHLAQDKAQNMQGNGGAANGMSATAPPPGFSYPPYFAYNAMPPQFAAYSAMQDPSMYYAHFGGFPMAGMFPPFDYRQQMLPPAGGPPPKEPMEHPQQPHTRSMPDPGEFSEDNQARALKRPRLVWTTQLHKCFVDAVNQIGVDKAVPKAIMQVMNVDGLTRENVASHLQKYRLQLRRTDDENSYEELEQETGQDGGTKAVSTRGNKKRRRGSAPMRAPMGEDNKGIGEGVGRTEGLGSNSRMPEEYSAGAAGSASGEGLSGELAAGRTDTSSGEQNGNRASTGRNDGVPAG